MDNIKLKQNRLIRKNVFLGVLLMNFIGILLFFNSCETAFFPPPPKPIVPLQTDSLEATFVTTAPSSINASYWKKADYIKVTAEDLSKNNLYGDGLLNLTGTFNGLTQFNQGSDPEIKMKAAYDNQKVYILMEWTDSDIDVSSSSWLHNGPVDPLKSDTAGGWTSQRNSDKVSLAFEINAASSAAGNFSNVGCLASCHNGAMQPQSGLVDIWNWDLALSEPMGYALDMNTDATTGFADDAGQNTYARNNIGTTNRSGPEYEWDGVLQSILRPDGSTTILDPAYFLINKTAFLGDIELGDTLYTFACASCHGSIGQGGDGPPLNVPAANRRSRQSIMDFSGTFDHTGATYFNDLTTAQQVDVVAKLKALAGVPGNFLRSPNGSASDISALSNVFVSNITNEQNHTVYKVLLTRNLETNNADDVQFSQPEGKAHIFGIALMDNDGKNHIGSAKQTIYFKLK